MGGPGSGNFSHWHRNAKKRTVEDCLSIDANRWTREGILRAGVRQSGTWRWTYRGGKSCSINYESDLAGGGNPVVSLSYSWTPLGALEPQQVNYAVRLTATRPRFGGLRWWFVCPLLRYGRPCGRRAGKLYLPPRQRYFGCRHCHQLTYTSCQESHACDRLFSHLATRTGVSPRELKRMLRRRGRAPDSC